MSGVLLSISVYPVLTPVVIPGIIKLRISESRITIRNEDNISNFVLIIKIDVLGSSKSRFSVGSAALSCGIHITFELAVLSSYRLCACMSVKIDKSYLDSIRRIIAAII